MDEAAFVSLLKPVFDESKPVLEKLMKSGSPDWLSLPRDFAYAENSPFILLLDGYTIAEKLTGSFYVATEVGGESAGAMASAVYDAVNLRLDGSGALPSALEIWTALFFYQRSDTSNWWMPEGSEAIANRLCRTLRAALVAGHYFPYAPTPKLPKADAYGGVVISSRGEVLLREVAGHFGGYVWTFAKGRPNADEGFDEAALREVKEETGYDCKIVRALPRAFGGTTSSTSFYLMEPVGQPTRFSDETSQIGWFGFEEAATRIAITETAAGRGRDIRVLDTANAVLTVLGRSVAP